MDDLNLDAFFGGTTLVKSVELYDVASKKIFTFKDLPQTYREVAVLESVGVLDRVGAESKWRKFNLIEFIWLNIVDELRTIGVNYPVIKSLKEKIHETFGFNFLLSLVEANLQEVEKSADKESFEQLKDFLSSKERKDVRNDEGISILYLMVIECLVNKAPLSVTLFSNGDWLSGNEKKSEYSTAQLERLAYDTHVKVSLAKIIKNFLSSPQANFVLPQLKVLTDNEIKILEIINSGDYETVAINFQNKKMKSMRLVKEYDVKKKLVDIIRESGYQDISVTSHNGLVTRIQNTLKVKLS